MKLSDFKGEDALDVIADIMEPLAVIIEDDEIETVIKSGKPRLIIAKTVLKRQKKPIMEILAILNNTPVDEFKPSLIELPVMLMELISDVMENPELASLFHLHPQKITDVSFGDATGDTQETEEI